MRRAFQDRVIVVVEPIERRDPEPQPLGRKRGARGLCRGFEKAVHNLKSETRKANMGNEAVKLQEIVYSGSEQAHEGHSPSNLPETTEYHQKSIHSEKTMISSPSFDPATSSGWIRSSRADQTTGSGISYSNEDLINNPVALLADVSDAARSQFHQPIPVDASLVQGSEAETRELTIDIPIRGSLGLPILNRLGTISLGLHLDRKSLKYSLEALFYHSTAENYPSVNLLRDVGADFDSVDLGLVTMEEAEYLFPIRLIDDSYFTRLHPINGILDPVLHTPDFVRSRSALLLTWLLALTSQLRLHGERLSKDVHNRGFKSVEIVQGYYISLLSATPAETLTEERSWLYMMYAFGVATEFRLDQGTFSRERVSQMQDLEPSATEEEARSHDTCQWDASMYSQRLIRNCERTWLRIVLWQRANCVAYGLIHSFPETPLTSSIESWLLHPLADSTDRHTFIVLRRNLPSLQTEIQSQALFSHQDPHCVRNLIDNSLEMWCSTWLPHATINLSSSPTEQLSEIFLRYVYLHGRFWTLYTALHCKINGSHNVDALRKDSFEAAVNTCEIAVHNLQAVGEPLYAMLAPTWEIISYAAVLALKVFPTIYGPRVEDQAELFAFLGQVALQLERAGATPSHRYGIAALYGQHLMKILRTKAGDFKEELQIGLRRGNATRNSRGTLEPQGEKMSQNGHCTSFNLGDQFACSTSSLFLQDHFLEDGLDDLFREIFGPGFDGVF
ncbi:transcriptional regulator family: Fungal Specific TF [Penicillium atrosanguineum]|uniref:Transcriptional regulator family: Fungal Specific TF n=1 Tax=Penicillium atrosanguineum TaxID=1132637 RepID=A0A9W9Q103_9EURO|nr:transcriptional regulator family: Fungal Specific TF [Penicillium atrosanguineum]KAJ5321585.1 transcriptional regulator family: Fungal Specific TF [Penicillium atrosanguineum]